MKEVISISTARKISLVEFMKYVSRKSENCLLILFFYSTHMQGIQRSKMKEETSFPDGVAQNYSAFYFLRHEKCLRHKVFVVMKLILKCY
jgi:hypothetical protein